MAAQLRCVPCLRAVAQIRVPHCCRARGIRNGRARVRIAVCGGLPRLPAMAPGSASWKLQAARRVSAAGRRRRAAPRRPSGLASAVRDESPAGEGSRRPARRSPRIRALPGQMCLPRPRPRRSPRVTVPVTCDAAQVSGAVPGQPMAVQVSQGISGGSPGDERGAPAPAETGSRGIAPRPRGPAPSGTVGGRQLSGCDPVRSVLGGPFQRGNLRGPLYKTPLVQ
jgi:hypothetical protein